MPSRLYIELMLAQTDGAFGQSGSMRYGSDASKS
jgi:hypothetical protein